ncbi:MAG: sulfatase family protein [Solirubrobacterales bacterium]
MSAPDLAKRLCPIVAGLLIAGCGGGGEVTTERAAPAAQFDREGPNIVVVMTDDQALDTMGAMPLTRRLIGERGTTFERAFVSFPLCCPSRATFLTGQYAHNHGVRNNGGPRGGYRRLDREHTLPVWLSRAGYRTGFVGKFLNGYGEGEAVREVPPGWSDWYGLPGKNKQRAFDFDLNENGELVHYGGESGDSDPYKTDVLADKAAQFVRRAAPNRRPFFLWVATNGPHKDSGLPDDAERNPEPAPRDRGKFEHRRAPRRTAVDEGDVSDKPRDVRKQPRLDRASRERLDREYVSQLESLASIDRLVGRLVRRLRAAGELDRTLFVFTTDNGYLRGQHRLEGKSRPYDEAIRVPLLVRGPGFPAGERDRRLVVNVDLAATILDAADGDADVTLDGHSLRPGADRSHGPRAEVLIEVFERKQAFTGLRTRRYTYAEYENGDRELYDLRRDPEQLENLARRRRLSGLRARLAQRLAELRGCAGAQECG